MYNFVDAVKRLPCNFTTSEMTTILRRVNPELKGQIRSLFVVLSDDLFRQILRKFEQKKGASTPAPSATPEGSGSGSASDGTTPAIPGLSSKGKSRSHKRGASSELSNQSKK